MRPENSSFEMAGQASVAAEGKPNRRSELRSPEGSNAVQAVNSFDAGERTSRSHEVNGALKHSKTQLKDSSRIQTRPEIAANDRPDGVPTPESGHSVHSAPEIKHHDWRAKGYLAKDSRDPDLKNYKSNADPTPSLKPSRKSSL
jgi:hypothetical protein